MTQTATAAPKASDFETPVVQTLDLPPLAILRIGDKVDFVMQETALVKDEDETRLYFRALLLADVSCQTKGKGEEDYKDITFKAGEMVTVPGSGSLDYQLARIANKKAGIELNAKEPKWAVLNGDRFVIERLEDDKMSKGRHKGKPVKTYSVAHAAKKSK